MTDYWADQTAPGYQLHHVDCRAWSRERERERGRSRERGREREGERERERERGRERERERERQKERASARARASKSITHHEKSRSILGFYLSVERYFYPLR